MAAVDVPGLNEGMGLASLQCLLEPQHILGNGLFKIDACGPKLLHVDGDELFLGRMIQPPGSALLHVLLKHILIHVLKGLPELVTNSILLLEKALPLLGTAKKVVRQLVGKLFCHVREENTKALT